MNYKMEVAVSQGVSTTVQGGLLEDIGKKVLTAMQYNVTTEVRLTGMEVDLLAEHKFTGEILYAECKAHNSNLKADVISKLLGNMDINDADTGWLITTGPLGKDAKGIVNKWEQKEVAKRKKLTVYTFDRIIDLLIGTKSIVSDKSLILDSLTSYRDESTLLISELGQFWLKIETLQGSTIADNVLCFSAITGQKITDHKLLTRLKELDTENKNLSWISSAVDNTTIVDEMKSVIQVTSGDEWVDYNPARPEDFVGREQVIDDVITYIDKVVDDLSSTRLFSITAPSGWGKSSFLLRLSNELHNKKSNSYFIYSIDLRAATSSRYAEFAIIDCFNTAIKEGFIDKPSSELTYSSASVPFEHDSFQEIFKQLKDENKVISICFDQFEEIFSKKELMNLFDNIKKISINVDSIKENLILGFAWKTDFVFPGEHAAYHMWHNLADRRKNFELTVFSHKEMRRAIKIFSKQINQQINKILQEYLIDQCQGYPWLLKKFCIHVYKLVTNGINQEQIIGQNMNIEDIFEKDLSELSPIEDACIRKIALETPADNYSILEIFGEKPLQDLIYKRLIIKKGNKLILYWDIFRDYVVDGKIPRVIFYYVPQLNFGKYIQMLEFFEKGSEIGVTIDEFSNAMGLSKSTVNNVIKDLIMFGNVEIKNDKIVFLNSSVGEAIKKIYSFWDNHIILKLLKDISELKSVQEVKELRTIFKEVHAFSHISEKTKDLYFNRILKWMEGLNILESDGQYIKTIEERDYEVYNSVQAFKFNLKRRNSEFMGQATYKKVVALMRILQVRELEEIEIKQYRNEIGILNSLDFTKRNSSKIELIQLSEDIETELIAAAKKTTAIQVIEIYNKNSSEKLTPQLVGELLKRELKKSSWQKTSIIRNGGGALRWYKRIYPLNKYEK